MPAWDKHDLQVIPVDLGIDTSEFTWMEADFAELIDNKFKPDLIGLSTSEPVWQIGKTLLEIAKKWHYPTIVGGIYPTLMPEEVLANDCVDMICVGEGEDALVELCNDWKEGYTYNDIDPMYDIGGTKNIWYKNIGGDIITNELRPPIDLDTLPFKDYTLFDKRRQYRAMHGKKYKVVQIEFTRGCPYSCTYCCNEHLNKLYNHKYFRERNPKKIAEELEYQVKKHGFDYFMARSESLLSMKFDTLAEFAMLYQQSKVTIPYWCQCRPETITEEKVLLLVSTGCEAVTLGIESGNEKNRKKMNKRFTNEQGYEAFRILKKYNLMTSCNIMIGLPYETREEVFDSIDFVKKVQPTTIIARIIQPYRGSTIRKECEAKRLLDHDAYAGDSRTDVPLKNPYMSRAELLGLQRTFPLYVRFPLDRWDDVALAERDDNMYRKLSNEYKEKYR